MSRFNSHVWQGFGVRCFGLLILVLGARLCLGLAHGQGALVPDVKISEIMYHPASEDSREEFIELWNLGETNVSLGGWAITGGVRYTFSNDVVMLPGSFLVVAADPGIFSGLYPDVTNVVGGWDGVLGNSRNDLNLDNDYGVRVDSVTYADEGFWARRWRGPLDHNHQGVVWSDLHDGFGRSLEWSQPLMTNNEGLNWGASEAVGGTPGRTNSIFSGDVAPLVVSVAHFPLVPGSVDTVRITVRLLDEDLAGVEAWLNWRVDGLVPAAFEVSDLYDDGMHEDGAAGDGVYGGSIPPQVNRSVVEFYIQARDAGGNQRVWPVPVIEEDLSERQVANCLYQVDDVSYDGAEPLYRIVMREADRAELERIGRATNGEEDTDAQFNGTWISRDGSGEQCRYAVGIRNRGHGSRSLQPNNYRVNFRSDDRWHGVQALNINGQSTFLQHLGSALCLLSGLPAAETRPVQLRVNGMNLGDNGPHTYSGCYVALEALNSDFADHRFGVDGSGNIYKALRDISPSDFNWRGENAASYGNTWFKTTNNSEDDWTDLMGMLRVIGTNDLYSVGNARQVADIDEWLTYLAVMAIFDNRETSPNTGHNDDYYLYSGVADKRFRIVPHDLDSILGRGSATSAVNNTIMGARNIPAFEQLLSTPEFETAYYLTLRRLLNTVFSAESFDAVMEQTLAGFVPRQVIEVLGAWMDGRRAYIQGLLPADLPADASRFLPVFSGLPRVVSPSDALHVLVSGVGVDRYRYELDGGGWSVEFSAVEPLVLAGLAEGEHSLRIEVGDMEGRWQGEAEALTVGWVVDTGAPSIRISEVLARNAGVVDHEGTFPDWLELYNEGGSAVDLGGLGLSDSLLEPAKFVFAQGTVVGAGEYLVVWANDEDGTSGLHAGFSFRGEGEGLYLFDRADRGLRLLDFVEFGLQLKDRSIGRGDGGRWVLCDPTPGVLNMGVATGSADPVRINEWLAKGEMLGAEDFVELYNPSVLPVDLGGLWMSDNLGDRKSGSRLWPMTFIEGGGHAVFLADGAPEKGAEHLSFKLSAVQGEIGLFYDDGTPIDRLVYGSQWPDISQGRQPSGSGVIGTFLTPTPGGPNPLPAPGVVTETVPLVTLTNTWRFNQVEDLTGQGWQADEYDDSGWAVGAGIFGFDADPIAGPVNTLLAGVRPTIYFRTQFDYAGDLSGVRLQYAPFIDDGAVFYLNGEEVGRLRMSTGPEVTYSSLTSVTVNNAVLEPGIALPAAGLRVGSNTLAVEVHQSSTTSGDVVFGMALEAVTTRTNLSEVPIVINEVVAAGQPATLADGTGDWVELYNASSEPLDISGMSLSDTVDEPLKYLFGVGSVLGAGERRVIACNDQSPPGTGNTGFGLSRGGDGVYLFDRPDRGGGLVDSVVFGMQVEGYSLGRIPDGYGGWGLTLVTPAVPNLPALLGDAALLRINEWCSNPSQGADWFELYNPQQQPVLLGGCFLSDDAVDWGKQRIPSLSFIGAGSTGHAVFVADGDAGQGADHVNFSLSQAGEVVALHSPEGSLIDQVSFGLQPQGASEGRFPDGAEGKSAFLQTQSRGGPNWLPLGSIVINELLAHTDPPFEDAVELYNQGSSVIDLSGWYLSNSRSDPKRYRIPEGTMMMPGEYHVIYEGAFGSLDSPTAFTFNSSRGDECVLSSVGVGGLLNGFRSVVSFEASQNGVSFGRYETSVDVEFVPLGATSFGMDAPLSTEEFRTGGGGLNGSPRVGPVVITELMVEPPPLSGTNDNTLHEFVELSNLLAAPQVLYDPSIVTNTWTLRGAVDYEFPAGTVLGGGEVVVLVSFTPGVDSVVESEFRAFYGIADGVRLFGPYRGKLGNVTESLRLYLPDPPQRAPHPDEGLVPQVLVEEVRYSTTFPWPAGVPGTGMSLQRRVADSFGNEPLNWLAAVPGPGELAPREPVTDADGDGLDDNWELTYWGALNNEDAVPGADPDGDGLLNVEEMVAGTSPIDAGSSVKVESVGFGVDGVHLTFGVVQGHSYSVEYSELGGALGWAVLADLDSASETGGWSVIDAHVGVGRRFYRLVTPKRP